MVTHLPFHGRAQISVQLRSAGIRLFLGGGQGRKRPQIHGFLSGLGSKQLRGFNRLLFAAAGKHHQHCHSRQGKAVQFANFHVSTPSCGLASQTKAGYQPRNRFMTALHTKAEKEPHPQNGKNAFFPYRRTYRREKTRPFFPSPVPNRGQGYLEWGGDSIGRIGPVPVILTLSIGNNL